MSTARLSIQELEKGIRAGDRFILAKAITVVESSLPEDQAIAIQLLSRILPETGKAMRVGITGVPGVGKSTFIEAFGKLVTDAGKKIAVLTIDPSSQLTRGSILGDKTRMNDLSKNPHAFIRPTASSTILGGVANRTREAMLLCEAAGFDVIIVETVGVGQSEVAVRNMVDFFLLLMLAGAGDELQGMKKGIMEMADAVVITKADGDNIGKANEALAEYKQALHLLPEKNSGWHPVARTCSAFTGAGVEQVWHLVVEHRDKTQRSGYWQSNRAVQNAEWFVEYFYRMLMADVQASKTVQEKMKELTDAVKHGKISALAGAEVLRKAWYDSIPK